MPLTLFSVPRPGPSNEGDRADEPCPLVVEIVIRRGMRIERVQAAERACL
jgi:hypothetical protein